MATALAMPLSAAAPIGHPLPIVEDPHPPRRIIYKEVDIVLNQGGFPINIIYLPRVVTDPPEDELDDFIANVINRPTVRASGIAPVTSPLDLNCREECFIMFKLADGWNWQFSAAGDAFTTKGDEGTTYFNLGHAKYQGGTVVKYPPGEAPGENCKLLFFRARGTPGGYQDPFNLAVELRLGLDQDGNPRRTTLVIDPDIRNPGGSEG